MANDLESAREYRADLRRRVAAAGRDSEGVAVMPGLVTYVGSTEEEARTLIAQERSPRGRRA